MERKFQVGDYVKVQGDAVGEVLAVSNYKSDTFPYHCYIHDLTEYSIEESEQWCAESNLEILDNRFTRTIESLRIERDALAQQLDDLQHDVGLIIFAGVHIGKAEAESLRTDEGGEAYNAIRSSVEGLEGRYLQLMAQLDDCRWLLRQFANEQPDAFRSLCDLRDIDSDDIFGGD